MERGRRLLHTTATTQNSRSVDSFVGALAIRPAAAAPKFVTIDAIDAEMYKAENTRLKLQIEDAEAELAQIRADELDVEAVATFGVTLLSARGSGRRSIKNNAYRSCTFPLFRRKI